LYGDYLGSQSARLGEEKPPEAVPAIRALDEVLQALPAFLWKAGGELLEHDIMGMNLHWQPSQEQDTKPPPSIEMVASGRQNGTKQGY